MNLDAKVNRWVNYTIYSLLAGSLLSLLGVLAGCAADWGLKTSIETAVPEIIKSQSALGTRIRTPHGGADEKSYCTPCEPAK